MIVAIRISGLVSIPRSVQETLFRMRLRKKYTAILIEDTEENRKLLESVRNFIAYGEISEETAEKLIEKRGKIIGKKKIDAGAVLDKIADKKTQNIKPFFRLHPPRGGIDSKAHYGVRKGVLGNNKEAINKLVERML